MPVAKMIIEPRLRRLYDHWSAMRGDAPLPLRAAFDPLDVPDLLGHLLLVEVLRDPVRFRIRVHGTFLAERAGYDLTGRMLDDLPHSEFRELAARSFRTVVQTGQPLHSARERMIDDRLFRYETVMLPMTLGSGSVDYLLIGLAYPDRSGRPLPAATGGPRTAAS